MRTPDEFRAAVAAGRLRDVPGVGPKTEARVIEALARADGRPRRARLLLDRARELVGAIADALGGEPAGDPRRWRDTCEQLAVVCAARDPGHVLDRFAALPQIVAVIERRARGLTVEGVAVDLVVAPPERFGTELVRATGSAAYVAALEPLPDGADEAGVYAALGLPWVPAGAARGAVSRDAAGAARGAGHPRRPALPHDVVRRPRERRGDGPGRARARLRVHGDLRPHAGRRRGAAA